MKLIMEVIELKTIIYIEVSNYAKVVYIVNLNKLSAILDDNSVYTFSLAHYFSTYHGKF